MSLILDKYAHSRQKWQEMAAEPDFQYRLETGLAEALLEDLSDPFFLVFLSSADEVWLESALRMLFLPQTTSPRPRVESAHHSNIRKWMVALEKRYAESLVEAQQAGLWGRLGSALIFEIHRKDFVLNDALYRTVWKEGNNYILEMILHCGLPIGAFIGIVLSAVHFILKTLLTFLTFVIQQHAVYLAVLAACSPLCLLGFLMPVGFVMPLLLLVSGLVLLCQARPDIKVPTVYSETAWFFCCALAYQVLVMVMNFFHIMNVLINDSATTPKTLAEEFLGRIAIVSQQMSQNADNEPSFAYHKQFSGQWRRLGLDMLRGAFFGIVWESSKPGPAAKPTVRPN